MRQTSRYSLNRLLHVSSDMDSARLFRRAFFCPREPGAGPARAILQPQNLYDTAT
nr:hypothetical protein X990_5382 [Burkholderia pseudomallei MSHR4868]